MLVLLDVKNYWNLKIKLINQLNARLNVIVSREGK
jgi:hypothetical protein